MVHANGTLSIVIVMSKAVGIIRIRQRAKLLIIVYGTMDTAAIGTALTLVLPIQVIAKAIVII